MQTLPEATEVPRRVVVPPPHPRESTLPRDCGQSSHLAVAQVMGLGITVSGRNSPDAGAPELEELLEVVSAKASSTLSPEVPGPSLWPSSRSHHPLPVLSLLQSPGSHRVGVMSQDKRGRPLSAGPHVGGAPGEEEQFLTITEGSWDTRSPLFTSTGWAVEGMAPGPRGYL